jgi:hypothetical protein
VVALVIDSGSLPSAVVEFLPQLRQSQHDIVGRLLPAWRRACWRTRGHTIWFRV